MDKAIFVKELAEFYMNKTENNEHITALTYAKIEPVEFVYVNYEGTKAQKRFYVTADNKQGIFRDFARFLTSNYDYDWISEGDAKWMD